MITHPSAARPTRKAGVISHFYAPRYAFSLVNAAARTDNGLRVRGARPNRHAQRTKEDTIMATTETRTKEDTIMTTTETRANTSSLPRAEAERSASGRLWRTGVLAAALAAAAGVVIRTIGVALGAVPAS